MSDVLAVLPFGNIVMTVEMSGKQILEMLEYSVQKLHQNDTSNLEGGFLQFSGLQVKH